MARLDLPRSTSEPLVAREHHLYIAHKLNSAEARSLAWSSLTNLAGARKFGIAPAEGNWALYLSGPYRLRCFSGNLSLPQLTERFDLGDAFLQSCSLGRKTCVILALLGFLALNTLLACFIFKFFQEKPNAPADKTRPVETYLQQSLGVK